MSMCDGPIIIICIIFVLSICCMFQTWFQNKRSRTRRMMAESSRDTSPPSAPSPAHLETPHPTPRRRLSPPAPRAPSALPTPSQQEHTDRDATNWGEDQEEGPGGGQPSRVQGRQAHRLYGRLRQLGHRLQRPVRRSSFCIIH